LDNKGEREAGGKRKPRDRIIINMKTELNQGRGEGTFRGDVCGATGVTVKNPGEKRCHNSDN